MHSRSTTTNLTKPIDMETKTLAQIKNNIAIKHGFENYNKMCIHYFPSTHTFYDEITKVYAMQECEKVRQDCADNAKMTYHDGHGKTNHPTTYHQMGADNIQIDKQSILTTPITLA